MKFKTLWNQLFPRVLVSSLPAIPIEAAPLSEKNNFSDLLLFVFSIAIVIAPAVEAELDYQIEALDTFNNIDAGDEKNAANASSSSIKL
eukprot:gene7050-4993_t